MAQQLVPEEELLDEQTLDAYRKARLESKSCDCSAATENYAEFIQGARPWRLSFAEAELLEQPIAIRRRVIREAYFSLAFADLDYERTLAVEQLLLNRTGGKLIQLPGSVTVQYNKRKLTFEKH